MRNLWICLFFLAIAIIAIEAKKKAKKRPVKVDQNDNFDRNLYRSLHTSDNRKISIYNNFALPSTVYLTRQHLSESGKWEITLNDYNNGSDYKEESPDHILWKTFLDPQFIQKTKFGQKLIRAVQHFKGDQQGDKYNIYHAAAKLVIRSEIPKSSVDSLDGDGDVSAILYLTGKWKKNDYGDILFYEANKEIVCAVHPQTLRLVMFDSSIEHSYKPPSVDHRVPLQTLHVKLTKSTDKLNNAIEHYKTRSQHRNKKRDTKLDDIAPVSSAQVIDVDKHITRQFVAKNGKKIYVLDNLYPPKQLDALRKLIEYKQYFYQDSVDDGSDGVSWLAMFSVQDFVDSNFWNIHQQVVRHVGSRQSYFPYDVSCNMIRSNDNTRLHDDCSQVADQWTMVTYLNPNWTAQMGGETAYFETFEDDNNYITEIRPRYGRSAIFQSTIYHSARPPSNDFNGIRYTFSVKMAEDEPQARLNRLAEDFQMYTGKYENARAIMQVSRAIGSKQGEKMVISMLNEDIEEDNSPSKRRSEEDEGEEQQSPNQEDEEQQSPNQENNQPSTDEESLTNQDQVNAEREEMLESYQNPHRNLAVVEHKKGEAERQDLIKNIDKSRNDPKVMAKLQLEIEEMKYKNTNTNSKMAAMFL